MYNNFKISNYQLFALLVAFMLGSSLIVNPAGMAKQDAWLSFFLGMTGGLLLLGMYSLISRLNPSASLTAILKRSFGNIMGTIISILYIWYFIHLASLVLRNFGEFSVTVSYPETPILFIVSIFALVIFLAVRSGIEILGRISEIFFIVLTLVLIFVFIGLVTSFDIENFKPFLSQGIVPVIKGAFSTLTFPFGETVVFLMVFPHVKKQGKILKTSAVSILVVGMLLLGVIARNLMVLGSDMVSRDVFPSHVVFRIIPGLDVDPLLDMNLLLGGLIKTGICIYAATAGITELLRLGDYKPFVLPLTAFIVSLSIWVYGSLLEMVKWAAEIWPFYSIPFQIILPLFMLIMSLIRKRVKQEADL
ncbi:MAG: endospore germination permease [Clostridia bacterium]|nr:endospore germination permease [Clostridia bacterium]